MSHPTVAQHPFDIVVMDHVSIDHQNTETQKVLTVVFFIHVNNEK